MAEIKPENNREVELDQDSLPPDNEYLKLRKLLLGPDYDRALDDYIHGHGDLERVAQVLPAAIKQCHSNNDKDLAKSLAPVLNKAIHESILTNSTHIVNAISPIMGPAIRKSVRDALRDLVQGLNNVLEQSFSLKSLSWRYQAWRAGTSYGRYVLSKTQRFAVEQVLLVHRETGLLLHSVADEQAHSQDPELVSSMLTAIQDFVSDSFETQSESSLDRVQIGDLTLHLLAGPHSVLAIAARGSVSAQALADLSDMYDAIQSRYAREIEGFEGDRDVFVRTEDELRACLIAEAMQDEEIPHKKPWFALLISLGLTLAFGYYAYENYLLEKEQGRILAALNGEPGYIVISHTTRASQFNAELLRSHNARPLDALEASLRSDKLEVELKASNITFDFIDVDKLNRLELLPPPPPPAPVSALETINNLTASIQTTHLFFEEKSTVLTLQSGEQLQTLISDIKQLSALITELGTAAPQIMIMGFADKNGTEYGNFQVSKKRADLVKAMLIENGVTSDFLVSWGIGYKDIAVSDEAKQRRVSIQILLPDMATTKTLSGKDN